MAKGDQIYVLEELARIQGVYEHHGIDCGDGSVINLRKGNATITRVSLREFVGGKKVYLKRYRVCFTPDVVVHRAKSRLGERVEYNLLFNNCEHFANWCKTGVSYSQQVQDFIPLLKRIEIESLSEPLQEALGGYAESDRLLERALTDIKRVWDDVQPRYNRTVEEMQTWQQVAASALQQNREDLARAALQRKQSYRQRAQQDKDTLDRLAKMTETLIANRDRLSRR